MTLSKSARQTDIINAVQVQDPGSALIVLYDIELFDGNMAHFTPFNDEDGLSSLFFRDFRTDNVLEYTAIPIMAEGFDVSSEGAYSRPVMTVANISNLLHDSFGGLDFEQLIGRKVTRRITLAKYLYQASNDVASGSPIEFPRTVFIIDRIKEKNVLQVMFELSTPFDLPGVMLPRRKVLGGQCPWIYKGANPNLKEKEKRGGCSWIPGKGNPFIAGQFGGSPNETLTLDQVPLFMNAQDEYILQEGTFKCKELAIDADGNVLGCIDPTDGTTIESLIDRDGYYKTTEQATKIETDGFTKTLVSVTKYWQARINMDINPSIYAPSAYSGNFIPFSERVEAPKYPGIDSTDQWAPVRVFEVYNPNKEYSGFTQIALNEYVVQYEGIPPAFISLQQFTPINDPKGDFPNTLECRLNEFGITSTNFVVKNLDQGILDRSVDGYGAVSGFTYTIKADEDGITMYLQQEQENPSIEEALETVVSNPGVIQITQNLKNYAEKVKLRRVKSASVPVLSGINATRVSPLRGSAWTDGDICGKNIESCGKRFQALIYNNQQFTSVTEHIELNSAAVITEANKIQIPAGDWEKLQPSGNSFYMTALNVGHVFHHFDNSQDRAPANAPTNYWARRFFRQGVETTADGQDPFDPEYWSDSSGWFDNNINTVTYPFLHELHFPEYGYYGVSKHYGSYGFTRTNYLLTYQLQDPFIGKGGSSNTGPTYAGAFSYNTFISKYVLTILQVASALNEHYMGVYYTSQPPEGRLYSDYVMMLQIHNSNIIECDTTTLADGSTPAIELYINILKAFPDFIAFKTASGYLSDGNRMKIFFDAPAEAHYKRVIQYDNGSNNGTLSASQQSFVNAQGGNTTEYERFYAGGWAFDDNYNTVSNKVSHKIYMTDDRTASGNDLFITLGFNELSGNDIRVSQDRDYKKWYHTTGDTTPLPFGGFPGSRKHQ